jgi:hypothetical protein
MRCRAEVLMDVYLTTAPAVGRQILAAQLGFFFRIARFVLISMTPFAPRIPYSAERLVFKHVTGEKSQVDLRLDWFVGTNGIPSAITISPSQPTVAVGATLQLSYVAYDQAGTGMAPSQQLRRRGKARIPRSRRSRRLVASPATARERPRSRSPSCPALSPGSPCKQATFPLTVFTGPPSLTAWINGPSAARPNDSCAWWAGVSGGTGSYTYNWYVNGGWQSNGQELMYTNSG